MDGERPENEYITDYDVISEISRSLIKQGCDVEVDGRARFPSFNIGVKEGNLEMCDANGCERIPLDHPGVDPESICLRRYDDFLYSRLRNHTTRVWVGLCIAICNVALFYKMTGITLHPILLIPAIPIVIYCFEMIVHLRRIVKRMVGRLICQISY